MRAACLILLALLTACLQEHGPATAIDVSVKSDLAATELSEIQYSVFARDGASEPIASQTAKGPALGQSFVIERGRHRDLRVVIEGRGARGKVRYEALARFAPEQTVALQVFLGRVCLEKSCAGGQTCVARSEDGGDPGTCVAVPTRERLVPVRKPGDEHAWDIPAGPPTGSMSTPSEDDAICDVAPGFACDPVHDCGCAGARHCQMRNGTPTCTISGTKPAGAQCRTDSECKDALACGLARTCTAQCEADTDCSGGTCARLPDKTFGTCLQLCSDGKSCPAGVPCSPFTWDGEPTKSACFAPLDPCPYRGDGRCDDPLNGTGLCVRGKDPEDCTCDPVKQTGCSGAQTCSLVYEASGAPLKECQAYGRGVQGSPCDLASDPFSCGRGLTCVSGLCHRYCDPAVADSCADDAPCFGLAVGEIDAVLGVCALVCTPNGTPSCQAPARCKAAENPGDISVCTVEP